MWVVSLQEIKSNVFVDNQSGAGSSNSTYGAPALYITGNVSADRRVDIESNIFVDNKTIRVGGNSSRTGGVFLETINAVGNFTDNMFYNNSLTGSTTIQGSDINTLASSPSVITGSFTGNKFQNSSTNYPSSISGITGFAQNNTFSNTEDGGIVGSGWNVDCYGNVDCVKNANQIASPSVEQQESMKTTVGISSVDAQPAGWPENVNSGALVLNSNQKGFVITRVNSAENDLGKDVKLAGAFVYDITDKCFKFFDGVQWGCVTKSCDTNIFQMVSDYLDSSN